MRSTKRSGRGTVTPAGGVASKPWEVVLHKEAGKDITDYSFSCTQFKAQWDSILLELETNPKQFPKKGGKIKHCRAASLKYGNVVLRAPFTLDEKQHRVKVLCVEPHDQAYKTAARRR